MHTFIKTVAALFTAILLTANVNAFGQTNPASSQGPKPILTSEINSTVRVSIPNSVNRLARPEYQVGAVAGDTPLQRMVLVLSASPETEQALTAYLQGVQDKSSADFHKWLSPEQFAQRFGPAPADVAKVQQWLQQEGFAVGALARSRRWIEFSGTASQVQRTFQTSMARYVVSGEQHMANATALSIPAALSPAVRGVLSLNDFPRTPHLGQYYKVSRNAQGQLVPDDPNFTLNTQGGAFHFLSPGDIASIYNLGPLYSEGFDGFGQTIAIPGRNHFQMGDVFTFRQIFGLPDNNPTVVVNGPDPIHLVTGDSVESSLDVEWAGAVAPGAKITFVASASTTTTDGIDLSSAYIVDNNLADIVSLSYGSCEQNLGVAGNAFYNSVWRQAAAQGMTVFVSSGDSGAAGCDPSGASTAVRGPGINGLGSTVYNIAVGGTQFNEDLSPNTTFWNSTNLSSTSNLTSAIGYIPEAVWDESCAAINAPSSCSGLFSTGGGVSTVYGKPSWQTGPGVPADGKRDVPDISLSASGAHDGYLICIPQVSCVGDNIGTADVVLRNAAVVGGTSVSSPAMAGMFALINQKMGGGRQGAANWMFYALANDAKNVCDSSQLTNPLTSQSCVFHDITTGNNNVPGLVGTTASAGYDLATGIGSVDATNLATAWSIFKLNPSSSTFSLGATTAQHGSAVQATINVAPTSGTGVVSGDVVLISDKQGPFATVTLNNGTFTGPISTLPGGQYNVTAHYGGDTTFAASDSNKIAVNISAEPSSTTLSAVTFINGVPSPVTSVPYGNFVYFHVTVAAAANGFTHATGGTVAFNEGATQLGTIELTSRGQGDFVSGGVNDFGAVICLPVGGHTITATLLGDDGLTSSTSAPVTVQVTKADPGLFFSTTAPITWPAGSPVPLSVSLFVPGTTVPTGTVQLLANGTPIGAPATLGPSFGVKPVANFELSGLTPNTYTISATYSGDANYLPSNTSEVSGPLTLTIQPPSGGTATTTTLSTPASSDTTGTVNYTVTVTSASGIPSGTVALTSPDGVVFSPATLTLAGGTATGQIQLFASGPARFAASYSGDATHAASASAVATITMPKITPNIFLTAIKTSVHVGERVTLVTQLTALRVASIPGDVVQYFDSVDGGPSQPIGPQRLLTFGSDAATFSMHDSYSVALPQGNHIFNVRFLGDPFLNSVTSAQLTVAVDSAPDFTVSQVAGLPPIVAGQSGNVAIRLTPFGGVQGRAAIACDIVPVGTTCSFTPSSVALNGTAATAKLTLSTTAPSAVKTAHDSPQNRPLNPLLGLGAGLFAACVMIGSRRNKQAATAVLLIFTLSFTIVSCGGGGGSSSTTTTAAASATSTSVSVSAVKVPQGAPFTVTARVSGSGSATGSVTFLSGTNVIGNASITNNVATLRLFTLPVGTHTITARYSGDGQHAASQSLPVLAAITGTTQMVVSVKLGTNGKSIIIPVTLQ